MQFSRVGGLSPVKYDRKSHRGLEYHRPPARKGIYTFIWPYFEPFLVYWSEHNRREIKRRGIRRFQFEGELFTHLGCTDSFWQLVHTCELPALLKRDQHLCRLHLLEFYGKNHTIAENISLIQNPYLHYSHDHLEVFIPKRELGKIR